MYRTWLTTDFPYASGEYLQSLVCSGYGQAVYFSVPGRERCFLFATVSKPFLGPAQPPVHWVLRAFFPRVELDPGLRMLEELYRYTDASSLRG